MSEQQLATTPQPRAHPIVQLRSFLDARANELKTALPVHISPERFIRVVMTAIQLNPDIAACDRSTLWNSCLRCANDGLIPDGAEAALVAYKQKVQYIPMYQGLVKKFRNSGEFKHINAGIVYEGEEFEHWLDETGEHFKHVPGDERDPSKIRRVYATATTKDGGFFIADMSLSEINKRKAMSRASREDAPWRQWEGEMQKKTALRQLSKLLPKSSDLDVLMQRDEAALLGVEAVDDRRDAIAASDPVSALQRFAQEEAAPEPPTEKAQPVIDLFDVGAEARKLGIPRDRPPGELRSADRAADLQQWHEGWDSKE